MKTSTISSISIQNALRHTVSSSQGQLMKAERESTTGKYDDIGVALGAKTTRSLDLNGELLRLQNLKDTNSVVTQRLSASQEALTNMSQNGQTILNALVALSGNVDQTSLTTSKNTITSAFTAFTGAANTSLNGEYLFSGINTDVKPLNDYFDPAGSPAKTAFNSALTSFLGAQVPPLASASSMSAAQMSDFIDNTLTPMYSGASWNTDWSQATNQNVTSRINRNELVETSANANSSGIRNMALATVISTELLSLNLATDVRQAAASKATAAVGQAISGLDQERGKLGLSEARVKNANDSLAAQKDIITTHLSDLEGVDGFEASTRVQNLKALVEASYSLTARIQQLSLVNYLK
nr:flagellar hook-associated family protein [uncultured Gellertiella sp.]